MEMTFDNNPYGAEPSYYYRGEEFGYKTYNTRILTKS